MPTRSAAGQRGRHTFFVSIWRDAKTPVVPDSVVRVRVVLAWYERPWCGKRVVQAWFEGAWCGAPVMLRVIACGG